MCAMRVRIVRASMRAGTTAADVREVLRKQAQVGLHRERILRHCVRGGAPEVGTQTADCRPSH